MSGTGRDGMAEPNSRLSIEIRNHPNTPHCFKTNRSPHRGYIDLGSDSARLLHVHHLALPLQLQLHLHHLRLGRLISLPNHLCQCLPHRIPRGLPFSSLLAYTVGDVMGVSIEVTTTSRPTSLPTVVSQASRYMRCSTRLLLCCELY